MECIVAILTDKHQTFVRPIGITCMTTHRASLACIVCVYLDCHRTVQEGLIGNHALQLSKRPLGISGIRLPLLLARFFASFAFGSLANVCQMFQADNRVEVPGHDRPLMTMSRRVAERVPFFCRRFLSLA